eukprot:695392-Lingulodinium_polyedra.AAC.1
MGPRACARPRQAPERKRALERCGLPNGLAGVGMDQAEIALASHSASVAPAALQHGQIALAED